MMILQNAINNRGYYDFTRAVVTLISGSVIAQVITLLASPILARLYPPEQQGVYTLVQSLATLFSMILSLRFDIVIISEKDEKKVHELVVLSSIICVIMSVLITLGSGIYLFFKQVHGISVMAGGVFVLFQCLLTGFINILISYNNRMREFSVISSTYAIRTGVQNALMITIGYFQSGVTGLLVGSTAGLLAGCSRQLKSLLKNKSELIKVNKNDLLQIAQSYKSQIIYSTPAAVLNGFFYVGLNLAIEIIYGTYVLGLYSYAFRILVLPMVMISSNITKVFMESASKEWAKKGEFISSYVLIVTLISLLSVPIWFCFTFFAPQLFRIFFGEQWELSGVYAQLLITLFCSRLIAACVGSTAIITDHQKCDLITQTILVLLLFGSVIVAYTFSLSAEQFFKIINYSSSFIYIVYIVILGFYANGYKKKGDKQI